MSETRICALCGRAFVILIPESAEEAESDKLCPDCSRRQPLPDEPVAGVSCSAA